MKFSSKINTCEPLGGEGCPAFDVREAAENRKSDGQSLAGLCRFLRERAENMHEKWHTVDTTNEKTVRLLFEVERLARWIKNNIGSPDRGEAILLHGALVRLLARVG